MAYEVIILGPLHMPLYFLGTFTEYPYNIAWLRELFFCREAYYVVRVPLLACRLGGILIPFHVRIRRRWVRFLLWEML